jgi:hypothetical protein
MEKLDMSKDYDLTDPELSQSYASGIDRLLQIDREIEICLMDHEALRLADLFHELMELHCFSTAERNDFLLKFQQL